MKRFIQPLLSAVAIAAALCASTAHADVPSDEYTALMSLYNNMDGANWRNKTGWGGAASTVCTPPRWHGVTCDTVAGQEHVVGLALPINGLKGGSAIGDSLDFTKLPQLRALRLDQNEVSGPFPKLGGLTQLRTLDLHGNAFTGPIADFWGNNLSSLEEAHLYANQFTGSTPTLSDLPKLRIFNAAGNKLDGTIGPLTGAAALEDFEVQNNRTAQNNTGLTGPIPSLAGLTKLRKLDVSNNRLDRITDLADHPVLTDFNASRNQLSGPIPSLAGLPLLYSLYLNDNELNGTIPELTGLNSLVYLHLQYNHLRGQIPASITALPKLAYFQIQNNQLVGSPPMPPSSLKSSAVMCPNPLRNSSDAAINDAWDPITGNGTRPWATGCTGSSDVTPIILDGAGNQVTDGSTGTISPGDTQILPNSSTPFSFSLQPAPGYRLRPPVPSNCAVGDLNGTTFAVSRLTANCYFEVTFVPDLAPGDEDGQCGDDHDHVLTTPPVNLCSVGTPSAVTGTGPWNWSCSGTGTGTTAQCQAYKSGAGLGFTVTATATGPGTAAPTTQTVISGARGTVIAAPDANSHLAGVSGCGATFAGNTVITAPVTADCTVTLAFAEGPAPAVQAVPTLGEWALTLLATLVGGLGLAWRRT